MCSHSNDGDGDVAGILRHIQSADYSAGARRPVSSGGSIPQVPHTYQYKTEGYSIMNEHGVGLCESTCRSVFDAEQGWGAQGLLNIVDLSQLALERSTSSAEAVKVMGDLAVKFGYHDAGESMLVVDHKDAWIFHVLPDDTNTSAIWAAQKLVGSSVASVANAFIIREIKFPLDGTTNFLGSANLRTVAQRKGWWHPEEKTFDFSGIFSLGELGPKYNTGRRMWETYRILAPATTLSPTYENFVMDRPYPTTIQVSPSSIDLRSVFSVMRSFYVGTPYDLTGGGVDANNDNVTLPHYALAAGPFGNPHRSHGGRDEATDFPNGRWERAIATWKTAVSYVVTTHNQFVWFAPHAAHTGVYVPFSVNIPAPSSFAGPVTTSRVNQSTGYWANRYVYHLSQLNFHRAYQDITLLRDKLETKSIALIESLSGKNDQTLLDDNANEIVCEWWSLSEDMLVWYGEGNCNGCGSGSALPRHLGYPEWWLADVEYNSPAPLQDSHDSHDSQADSQDSTTDIMPSNRSDAINVLDSGGDITTTTTTTTTTVLITGATGRTGSSLYHMLRRRQDPQLIVRGLVRNVTKAKDVLGCIKCDPSEGIYVGDVTQPSTLPPSFRDVDVVVILTGSYPIQLPNGTFVYPKGGTPREVDYLGTNNQVNAARSVRRIVLVSSMGTTTPGSFLDLLGGGYALSYKLNAEVYLMQSVTATALHRCPMEYTIVKPAGLLTATQKPTNATYLIGHNDFLPACSTASGCREIARSDVANVLSIAVTNASLFVNVRFDLSSDPKKLAEVPRDWNEMSLHSSEVDYHIKFKEDQRRNFQKKI